MPAMSPRPRPPAPMMPTLMRSFGPGCFRGAALMLPAVAKKPRPARLERCRKSRRFMGEAFRGVRGSAIQCPQENLPLRNRRRRINVLTKIVAGDQLEFGRRFHHVGHPFVGGEIEEPV